ncbi:unnamed protein product [Lactuca virosa]|uniref:Pollen Ole e 1 allergen and extensin family protein n=1 Tax=Lactuca virosa TaxID=75947 RepID=A0AAU9PHX4_9ASTR|nr:unnamed protein product [Lactuca virosa]
MGKLFIVLFLFTFFTAWTVKAWTGEIHGRVVCDVCADGSVGPEDHVLEGAEVAVLCITKSGEVLNYQAFTNSKGIYTVAETMPESERWDACLARPISSFHEHCTHLGDGFSVFQCIVLECSQYRDVIGGGWRKRGDNRGPKENGWKCYGKRFLLRFSSPFIQMKVQIS